MSRCFPFPPPGYENKARSDRLDLLNRKEKEHKKEKRHKEKREGKGKKDKDRSKDKHKDKKDRKEKYKDEKKDNNRDTDKSRTLEDRRVDDERFDGHHEVKLGGSSQRAAEDMDSKFTEDLGRRIRDEEKGATNNIVENFTDSTKRRLEGMDTAAATEKERVTGNGTIPISFVTQKRLNDGMGRSGDSFSASVQRSEGMGMATAVEKGRATSNNMVANLNGIERRRNHGMGREVDNFTGSLQETVEGLCRPEDSFSASVQRSEGMDMATAVEKGRGTSNNIVANLNSIEKRRNHGMGRGVDKVNGSIQEKAEGLCPATAIEKGRGVKNNMVSKPIGKMTPNLNGREQKRNNGIGRPMENSIVPKRVECLSTATAMEEERGKINDTIAQPIGTVQGNDGIGRPVDNLTSSTQRRIEGTGSASSIGKERVATLIVKGQRRNDGMGGSLENGADNAIAQKEKTRDREAVDSKGEKLGDREDRNAKKSKGNNKDRHKDKEKEEKKRKKGERKHKKEHDKARDSGKKDLVNSLNIKPLAPHKDNLNSAVTNGDIKKRKDFEINGSLHENGARPSKFPRTSSSSHRPLENGTTLESSPIVTPSIRERAASNSAMERVLDDKEHKINGVAEPRPSVDLRHPFSVDSIEKEIPLKPPHPDLKSLSQIYSVPIMEEWPESEDQEWLFIGGSLRAKPETKIEAEETPQVAVRQIVCSLPSLFIILFYGCVLIHDSDKSKSRHMQHTGALSGSEVLLGAAGSGLASVPHNFGLTSLNPGRGLETDGGDRRQQRQGVATTTFFQKGREGGMSRRQLSERRKMPHR